MTIKEAMNQAIIMLKNENIEFPKNKARMLLEATLNKNKEYLIIYDSTQITKKQQNMYMKNIKRLIMGEPLQYITGKQEFMKLDFFVNNNVLIPRPDTEILVEEVISIATKIENPIILELGTGSGAISISLAKYIKNTLIYSIDISKSALDVASKNAKLNKVQDKIKFIQSDMFEEVKKNNFDIIVSNPPYIEKDEILKLPKDVQKEPRIALDGGEDGLKFYREIIKNAPSFVRDQGYLCLEIGYNQKNKVLKIFKENINYKNIYVKKDFCGNDRVIISQVKY